MRGGLAPVSAAAFREGCHGVTTRSKVDLLPHTRPGDQRRGACDPLGRNMTVCAERGDLRVVLYDPHRVEDLRDAATPLRVITCMAHDDDHRGALRTAIAHCTTTYHRISLHRTRSRASVQMIAWFEDSSSSICRARVTQLAKKAIFVSLRVCRTGRGETTFAIRCAVVTGIRPSNAARRRSRARIHAFAWSTARSRGYDRRCANRVHAPHIVPPTNPPAKPTTTLVGTGICLESAAHIGSEITPKMTPRMAFLVTGPIIAPYHGTRYAHDGQAIPGRSTANCASVA